MIFFSRAHERVLRKFIVCDVDFVLIGGHAAIYHGVQRTTGDLDILVRPTVDNGARIIKACGALGLDINGLLPEDFTKEQLFTFGFQPASVDILNFSKGLLIDDIFNNAIVTKLDKLKIKIIDIRDLLKNKKSIKRSGEKNLVDQQDILALKRILQIKE